MSYFQIAIEPDKAPKELLSEFIEKVRVEGIALSKIEPFDKTHDLLGYNIHIEEVEETIEKKISKKIEKIARELNKNICIRFRFKNWSY